MDLFDGYLAGLMRNAGWIVALRAVDRTGGLRWPWSGSFVAGLLARRDPLFGRIVGNWQITEALTGLAADSLGHGLRRSDSVLARLLLAADRQADLDLLGGNETQVAGHPNALDDETQDTPTLVRRSTPTLVRKRFDVAPLTHADAGPCSHSTRRER